MMGSNELGQWLVEATIAFSAAVVLVLLLRRAIRRYFGASAAYACWLLVPALLIAVSLPAMRVTHIPSAALHLQAQGAVLGNAANALPAQHASGLIDGVSLMFALTMMWLAGALVMLTRLVLQQRAFQRDLGALKLRQDGLLQADCIAGLPAVVGLWRPRIVVPGDFDLRFDAKEREVMFAHERSHIAAGDLQANALAAAVRCVFWFHPLAHYACLRFRQDQEVACDARVMRAYPASRHVYGEAMLKAIGWGTVAHGCHWAPIHPIKERIQMLKQPLPTTTR